VAQVLKASEKSRFEQRTLKYLDALYNFAMWLTGREEDAKDLVQETYLKAFRFAHQFQEGTNLKAWLFRILRNTFINLYWKRSKEVVGGVEGAETEPSYTPSLPSGAFQEELERRLFGPLIQSDIEKALNRLPEAFRIPIILSDLEGFSQAEIAEILGCPIGTVKSRLYRGRRILRDMLSQYA